VILSLKNYMPFEQNRFVAIIKLKYVTDIFDIRLETKVLFTSAGITVYLCLDFAIGKK